MDMLDVTLVWTDVIDAVVDFQVKITQLQTPLPPVNGLSRKMTSFDKFQVL